MHITAHGGALNTGRNSKLFFNVIKDYNVDIIEVDIRSHKGKLILSHLPTLFPAKKLPLRYAFEFCKKHGFKINCDLKEYNLVRKVIDLAYEIGVVDKILFTGNTISKKDLNELTAGELYLNKCQIPLSPIPQNVANIKDYINKLNNPNIKGINFNHKKINSGFLEECIRQDLAVSLFTPDTEALLQKYTNYPLFNITTNRPDKALEFIKRKIKK